MNSNDIVEVKYKNGSASLVISEIYPEDAGCYTCKATNPKGCVSTSSNIKIIPSQQINGSVLHATKSPPRIYNHVKSLVVNDGDPVMLKCTVACESPFQVMWLHNEREIKSGKDFKYINLGGNSYGLEIPEIFPEDAGTYTCEAYNDAGECFSTCTLSVSQSYSGMK